MSKNKNVLYTLQGEQIEMNRLSIDYRRIAVDYNMYIITRSIIIYYIIILVCISEKLNILITLCYNELNHHTYGTPAYYMLLLTLCQYNII